MSVIIAYRRGDTVYMGTDTQIIDNDTKINELCPSGHKIQRVESGILVGVCADRTLRHKIFAYSEIFTTDKQGKLTKKHIVTKIVPKLMSILDEEGFLDRHKGEDPPTAKANVILAHGDRYFEICSNFMVIEYRDFQAIGQASYVIPLLSNIKETDDVNERIVEALTRLSKTVCAVGAPFLLIDTKEGKYKLVGGNDGTC